MIYAVLETAFFSSDPEIQLINPDYVIAVRASNSYDFDNAYCQPGAVQLSILNDSQLLYVKGPILSVVAELTRAHQVRHGMQTSRDLTIEKYVQNKAALNRV